MYFFKFSFESFQQSHTCHPDDFFVTFNLNSSTKMSNNMSSKTVSDGVNKLRLYAKTFHKHVCEKLTGVLSDFDGVIGGDEVMGYSTVGSQLSPVDANNVNIVIKVFNIS